MNLSRESLNNIMTELIQSFNYGQKNLIYNTGIWPYKETRRVTLLLLVIHLCWMKSNRTGTIFSHVKEYPQTLDEQIYEDEAGKRERLILVDMDKKL